MPIYGCASCGTLTLTGVRMLPNMQLFACDACIAFGRARIYHFDELENIITPMWTYEQYLSLDAYQNSHGWPPFVCKEGHVLKAFERGLYCEPCDYRQNWAYDWTLNWSWRNPDLGAAAPSR